MCACRHVIAKGGLRETLFRHCVCSGCRETTSSSISAGTRISRTMASDSGNKYSSNNLELTPEHYQEDALDYDYYRDENVEDSCDQTREQKLQRLQELDDKAHCSRKVGEVYPNTGITTPKRLKQQIEEFEQLKKEPEYKEFCDLENSPNDTTKQIGDHQERDQ